MKTERHLAREYIRVLRAISMCLAIGAAQPSLGQKAIDGRELVKRMFEAREALVSGECIIRAEEVNDKLDEPRMHALRLVFDFEKPAWRATPLENPVGHETLFLVDSYYQPYPGFEPGTIRSVTKLSPRRLVRDGGWVMDFRLLGLASQPTEFERNWTNDYAGMKRRFLNGIDYRVVDEADLKKVSFNDNRFKENPSYSSTEWTLWIDPAKGYVNVKTRAVSLPVPPVEETPKLRYTAEMQWQQIKGYWVPVAMQEESAPGFPLWRFQCTLEWKRVNEPIDPGLFEVEDLVPEGQSAWLIAEDPTTGVSALVQKIGASNQQREPARLATVPRKTPKPEPGSLVIPSVLIAVGIFVLAVGVVAYARRKRKMDR
ncbi:MAG: hypothetical protein KatS3mg111_1488 [Pirellulaceae bacterium]|nr:MAG: hypothetical protein KatS3mg111_1488 [Pirellulaceae bacterium]